MKLHNFIEIERFIKLRILQELPRTCYIYKHPINEDQILDYELDYRSRTKS